MSLPYPSYNNPFPGHEELASWEHLPVDEKERRQKRLAQLRTAYYGDAPYPSYYDPFPSYEETLSWDSLPIDEQRRRNERLGQLRDEYYDEVRGGRPLIPGQDYSLAKARFESDMERNGTAAWARRQQERKRGEQEES